MSNASDFQISEFKEDELGFVCRLIDHIIDVCYAGIYPPRALQYFKEFHSAEKIMERHRKGNIILGKINGTLIATGSIVGADIFGVFVHPAFQRCGYGRTLMIELENRAKLRGCTAVELSISLPAKKFYENLGYEMREELSIDVGEEQYLIYWKAKKPLV